MCSGSALVVWYLGSFYISVSVSSELDAWFLGCFNSNSGLDPGGGVGDLDPVHCSARCLKKGYTTAAVTSGDCYCGNQELQGLLSTECLNTTSKHVPGQRDVLLPVGLSQTHLALYRTSGPFVEHIRVSVSPHQIITKKTFTVHVSGALAAPLHQSTGILGLEGQDLSYVTVEFLGMTPKGQSSHHVNIRDDGSFNVSSNGSLDAPGMYEIMVIAANVLSTVNATLHVSVLQSSTDDLVITLLLGAPLLQLDLYNGSIKAAFLNDTIKLQAKVDTGESAKFHWCLSLIQGEERQEQSTSTTTNQDKAKCGSSTLEWVFDRDGLYMMLMNATSLYGCTQEKIYVVVVPPSVFKLSETPLRSGAIVSLDVELLSTMVDLLLLNFTLTNESTLTYINYHEVKNLITHNRTQSQTIYKNGCCQSNHGNTSSDHNVFEFYCSTHCKHAFASNIQDPIHPLHTFNLSWQIQFQLPSKAGQYCLQASVQSTTESFSILKSTVQPHIIKTYDCIHAIWPGGNWKLVASTNETKNLEVVSNSSTFESKILWTISLNDLTVKNVTTEKWHLIVSFTETGCYSVMVKAFNPINSVLLNTHILVQNPIGGLMLKIPANVTGNQNCLAFFSIGQGSNVTVSLSVNGTCLYRDNSFSAGEEAKVVLLFNHTGTVVVELKVENIVSSQSKSVRIWVEEGNKSSPENGSAVKIYSAKQAYPTNTEVDFSAQTDVEDSMEFLWHFGDSTSARSISRTISKRYRKPGRYNVTVLMSTPWMSVTSEPFEIIIQRAVKLNRLVHQASVLQNHTVTINCRVNVGTDLNFLWRFGDGSVKLGESTEEHLFHSLGEFTVEVVVSNLVSNASLQSHIFVVDKPCHPPTVKNRGPLTIKVHRYEAVHLGVTYETEIDCDVFISGGIRYTWTLYSSTGQAFPLPNIDTRRQSLIVPSYFLPYDTYTAIAKVQVVGSVVYSNYSVRVKVIQSAPVAVIHGGTNVFISYKNTTMVILDGTKSYDLDFPQNTVRLSWTCKPISTISTPCFDQHVPMSSPLLTFPATFLKRNFDQFRFTLTIESAGRSASSDVFLTVKENLLGKVSVDCPQCQYNQVNWDQPFSVHAFCEDCQISPNLTYYTWCLYQVNASSKPVNEVPFCYTLDLSAPSAIKDTSSSLLHETLPWYPMIATPHPPPPPRILRKQHRRSFWDPAADSQMDATMIGSGEGFFDHPIEELEPFDSSEVPSEYSGHGQYSDQSRQSSESTNELDGSADWVFPLSVLENGGFQDGLDTHYESFLGAEEGESEISPGRNTVEDGESIVVGDDSTFDPGLHREEGNNLVGVRPVVMEQEQTLLDLPRDRVAPWIFESYTFTGISSSELNFKPFSLRPGSRYMLEVTATDGNLDSQKHLGRTQFFFQTQPAPKGMTCQVQPKSGVELHTVFSIFCTSGKEDLLYKYSFSVGDKPPRTLYYGRDFEYYFSLPAGDGNDDYKVTVSIEIRSSTNGGTTKPCPVTVTVKPQFIRGISSSVDPVLELSQIALRNLSTLVRLGNGAEILNYISIVSGILNRLSLEHEANTEPQIYLRNVLVCIVCEISNIDQVKETSHILQDLLQFTKQITLPTARKVTGYIQTISEQPSMTQDTLNAMISLLSYNLKTVTSYVFQNELNQSVNSGDLKDATEILPDTHNAISTAIDCLAHSGGSIKQEGVDSAKQFVDSILATVSVLMLKFILHHKLEVKLSTSLISVYATRQNQSSKTVSIGSAIFFLPPLLPRLIDSRHHQQCVVSVVTELKQNPFTWTDYHAKLTGPVVELNLFRCSTRRKIPIRFFSQPINIKLQPPKNQTFVSDYILHPDKINYHSFNITYEHLQHAIQLRVQFTQSTNKMVPVMMLFRMFDKPTSSVHHLRKTYNWERGIIRITLPSSYLNAAGVGYLALLNADFAKASRWKHVNTPVSYSVTVDSSVCLSWDSQTWTPHGCKTQAADTTSAINCSCHQLRPVTVLQQQITSSFESAYVDPIISVSHNCTVIIVLVICLCIYIAALVMCRNTDVSSGEKRVHFLSDNLPCEPYLYAVTIHTGLCSAAEMTAKVYIVLCGDESFSQTKELQVPGCTFFRRNSQDTFIISSAESLGLVCGIHIWHDNCGPSPTWYLKRVEVCELNRGEAKGRAWLFDSQCWLAVDKGDGRVERMLRVCDQEIGFAKMLNLKVCDYIADFHLWISVYSCPRPNSFTHCQRLSMGLLLLLGYACVNTVIISQMDDKLPLETDVKDISVTAVTTGIISAILVFPTATLLSFLFRLHEDKLLKLKVKCTEDTKSENVCFEDHHSLSSTMFETYFWSSLQQWLQESWRKKYQDTDLSSVSTWDLEYKDLDQKPGIQTNVAISKEDIIIIDSGEETQSSCLATDEKNTKDPHEAEGLGQTRNQPLKLCQWCRCVAWVLWLLLCTSCLTVCALLGGRFNNSEAVLWIHSLFFSVLFCIFFIHPLLILAMAVVVSMCYNISPDVKNVLTLNMHKSFNQTNKDYIFYRQERANLLKILEARQRVRFLSLVQPPTVTELRKSRHRRKKEGHLEQTLRDWCVFGSLLFLMLCVTFGSSSSDCYNLNKAVKKYFESGQASDFMSIQTYDQWWRWAQTSLLNLLYKNTSDATASHFLIGEPVLWKTEIKNVKEGIVVKAGLGHTMASGASKLNLLYSEDWISRQTVAIKVHFTIFSPSPNLFTSVALKIEKSGTGVLLPSANVQSVTVFHIASAWDYIVMVCQLLFLVLLLIRLCHHILILGEKGLMRYCKIPCNWLEIVLLIVALVYYVYCIDRTVLVGEVAELLQKGHSKKHVDISQLATWDQNIRSLRGTMLFLLTLRCLSLINKTTLPARSISSLLWLLIAGLICVAALSCVGNLLHVQNSWGISFFPRSFQSLLYHRPIIVKDHLNSRWKILYHGAVYVLTRLVWTALVINVALSSVKSLQRRDMFTTAELVQYIKRRLLTSCNRSKPTDHHMERKTYYFEEFESVLDELLFRLNSLSNSLQQTLPSKACHYKDDSTSAGHNFSKIDTEDHFKMELMEPLYPGRSEPNVPQKVHQDENGNQRNPEVSCRILTLTQTMSSEMVVEVLIHKEQDRASQQLKA